MNVHCSGAAEVVVSPHFAQELLSCEYPLGMASKETKKFEFLKREIKSATIDFGLIAHFINGDA